MSSKANTDRQWLRQAPWCTHRMTFQWATARQRCQTELTYVHCFTAVKQTPKC